MDALEFRTVALLKRDRFEIEEGNQPQNAIIYLLDGTFSCQFPQETAFIAKAGDFVFFPMTCRFRREVLTACTFYLIYFQIMQAHPLAGRIPHGLVRFQNPERMQDDIRCIERLKHLTDEAADCLRQHALNDILYQYCSENLPQPPGMQLSQEVSAVIAFFTEQLAGRITLKQAAASVNLSPNGLIGRFKAETGFTPIDYLIRLRMAAAKQLLSDTDLPVSVIAAKVGYEDIYYFSNAFHKVCGCAPSAYRAASPKV